MNMDDLQKSRYKRRGSPQWGVSGGALRNLQAEVKVLEKALHCMVFVMGQKEEQRRRGGEAKPSQPKPLPKGCHESPRTGLGGKDQEACPECRSMASTGV